MDSIVRYIAIQKYDFIIILILHYHFERVCVHSDFSSYLLEMSKMMIIGKTPKMRTERMTF